MAGMALQQQGIAAYECWTRKILPPSVSELTSSEATGLSRCQSVHWCVLLERDPTANLFLHNWDESCSSVRDAKLTSRFLGVLSSDLGKEFVEGTFHVVAQPSGTYSQDCQLTWENFRTVADDFYTWAHGIGWYACRFTLLGSSLCW